MLLIKKIVANLQSKISDKYDKFTFIELIKRLWGVTFPCNTPQN